MCFDLLLYVLAAAGGEPEWLRYLPNQAHGHRETQPEWFKYIPAPARREIVQNSGGGRGYGVNTDEDHEPAVWMQWARSPGDMVPPEWFKYVPDEAKEEMTNSHGSWASGTAPSWVEGSPALSSTSGEPEWLKWLPGARRGNAGPAGSNDNTADMAADAGVDDGSKSDWGSTWGGTGNEEDRYLPKRKGHFSANADANSVGGTGTTADAAGWKSTDSGASAGHERAWTGTGNEEDRYIPKPAVDHMPFVPRRRPARNVPTHTEGAWAGRNFTLDFTAARTFDTGFVASVRVEPWVPGAVFVLNYSGTDVAIQRLWNGAVIYADGAEVTPYDMLTGKSGQTYIVRLHDHSVPSSWGSPPHSFSFMAHGTAQAPQMEVGCSELLDDDDSATARDAVSAADPDADADARVLQYSAQVTWPGGFLGNVQVSPWNPGDLVHVDFSGSDCWVLSVWNAEVVDTKGQSYKLRLERDTQRAWHAGHPSPAASIGLVVFGSPAKPRLRNTGADPSLRLTSVPILSASSAGLQESAYMSKVFSAFAVGVLVTAGAIVGANVLAARHRRRAAEDGLQEAILNAQRI